MMKSVQEILLIGLGGFVGANVRYWVSGWAADRLGQAFPWGTLIVNFSGSCLLAVFAGWLSNHINVDPRVRLFAVLGFFGAFTTFSTYATESVALFQGGDWLGALGNILGSNLLCLAGVFLGLLIGRQL